MRDWTRLMARKGAGGGAPFVEGEHDFAEAGVGGVERGDAQTVHEGDTRAHEFAKAAGEEE